MSDTDRLIRRARAFAQGRGIALTYVSKLIFRDHRRLAAVESGTSFLRPPTLAKALKRLDELEAAAASTGEARDV